MKIYTIIKITLFCQLSHQVLKRILTLRELKFIYKCEMLVSENLCEYFNPSIFVFPRNQSSKDKILKMSMFLLIYSMEQTFCQVHMVPSTCQI